MTALAEYYFAGDSNAPHEALGRAARRLSSGGALYLGGGVGIEKRTTKQGDQFDITRSDGSKKETLTGPLSAVMRAFTIAGTSTATDTPGGTSKITDPAAAARLRELNDAERETVKDIERYERRVKAKAAQPQPGLPLSPNQIDDQTWEQRRLAELKAELAQFRAERTALISSGKVEEVEQERPGSNFTKIPPKNVKTLAPLIKHYKAQAKPFTACVADQVKHGLSDDHAKRRCAVVKDLGQGTTKWRKGGGHSKAEESVVLDYMERACEQVEAIDAQLGAGAAIELAERAGATGDATLDALGEMAFDALGTLFVCGHPLGECWQQVREGFTPGDHPRDFLGQWKKKVGGLKDGESTKLPDGTGVRRQGSVFHVSTGAGRARDKATTKDLRAMGNSKSTDRGGSIGSSTKADHAAVLAAQKSAQSDHPHSLGGTKKYKSLNDFERAQADGPRGGGSGFTRAEQANNVTPHPPAEAPKKDQESFNKAMRGESLAVDEQRSALAHTIRHGLPDDEKKLKSVLAHQKKGKVQGLVGPTGNHPLNRPKRGERGNSAVPGKGGPAADPKLSPTGQRRQKRKHRPGQVRENDGGVMGALLEGVR